MKFNIIIICLFIISLNGMAQVVESEQGIYDFIENTGQWPDQVLFKSSVQGGNIWLEKKGILYQFSDHGNHYHAHSDKSHESEGARQQLVYAKFIEPNAHFEIETEYPGSTYYNYYLGNDRSKWTSGNRSFNRIKYKNLYNGVDLVFFEKNLDLKYEYHLSPGANYKQIQIQYKGADKVRMLRNGNVGIITELGQIIEQKPYVYQIKNGRILEVESKFILDKNNIISFELGAYDKDLKLIIDPILIFATYNGATSDNFGMTATYAYDGKAYSGGIVFGNNYPTPVVAYDTLSNFSGVSSAQYGITDVFITKFNETGTNMLWTTFIGGGDDNGGTETVHSLICDTDNNVYLYGATSSQDFPTVNAYQNTHGGGDDSLNFYQNGVFYTDNGTDIFVAKFSEDGANLLGSTFVGGSGNDGVNYTQSGIAFTPPAPAGFSYQYDSLVTNYGDQFRGEIMLDSLNNIIIASSTRSTDFPLVNAFQNLPGGDQDGVVFKLSADFSTMLWSSFFGGSENDACYSVKIDSSYNVVIAGSTSSSDLQATTGGLNPNYLGGETDGFVAKISENGSTLLQTTYIGTSVYDQTIFVEIDRWDNVYITGVSEGTMPIQNAVYSVANSGQYIMKLNPDLNAIQYATTFGNGNGLPNLSPAAFLVDVCGNVYVSGWGGSVLANNAMTGMPISANAFQSTPGDGFNFYLFVLERDAQSLLYGSYMGGPLAREHVDGGTSRFDKNGIVYQSVCGGCQSPISPTPNSDFPTTPGAWSATNNSTNCNNLVFKFDFQIVPDAEFTVSTLEGCSPLTINFTNQSTDPSNSVWDLSAGGTIIQGGTNPIVEYTDPGTYEAILYITDSICNLTDTAKKIITVLPTPQLTISNDTILCDDINNQVDLIADGFGTVTNFTWANNPAFNPAIVSGPTDSVLTVNPTTSTIYYVRASNGNPACDQVDSVIVQLSSSAVNLMPDTEFCLGDTINIFAQFLPGVIIDWEPDDDIISVSPDQSTIQVSPAQSQYYYISASVNGCEVTDSVWVEAHELDFGAVMATAQPDELAKGGSSVLTGTPLLDGYSYSWSPSELVLNPNQNITSTTGLLQDTWFNFEMTDGVCSAETAVFVKVVEFVCGDVYVFVPNAFSPNNDGHNEKVFVRGQNIEEMTFKIFDRWGEMVFESFDTADGWDGTFKSEPLDPDVYVYHLRVRCVDGQQNLIKGNITILK